MIISFIMLAMVLVLGIIEIFILNSENNIRQAILDKSRAAQLARKERIIVRATLLFKSRRMAEYWFFQPNPIFFKVSPYTMSFTDSGTDLVINHINECLEHMVSSTSLN